MGLFSNLKIKKIQKAIEKYPDIFKNYRELINTLLREGDEDAALEWIGRALEREWPPEESRWLTLQHLRLRARRGASEKLLREAYRMAADEALDADTRAAAALITSEAIETMRQTGTPLPEGIPPKDEFPALLADLASRVKNPEESVPLQVAAAEAAISAGRTENALDYLDNALETAENAGMKNKGELYFRAGAIAREAGLTGERIKRYFNRAVEDGSLPEEKVIQSLYEIGNVLRSQDDLLGAMDRYEAALRFAGKRSDALATDIRFALAQSYFEAGRVPQAESEMNAVLAADAAPGDRQAEYRLWWAEALFKREEKEDALRYIREALDRTDAPALRRRLHRLAADILLVSDRPADAVTELERALETAPENEQPDLRLALGRAKRLAGAFPAAVKIFRQLRSDPAFAERGAELDFEEAAAYEGQVRVLKALELYLKVVEEGDETLREKATRAIHRLKRELSTPEGLQKYKITGSDRKQLAALLARSPEEEDFFDRLKKGLFKTKDNLVGGLERILAGRSSVDDEVIDEIEELLILSDLGVDTTRRIMDGLRDKLSKQERKDPETVRTHIREQIEAILRNASGSIEPVDPPKPYIIMVVGVNGVGKTTTIAKIARRFTEQGRSVLLAAGDTFRAGAIEQLQEWGRRLGVDVIAQAEGSDPSAVAWDAVAAAKNRNVDILIVDTAGRLHTKYNLMEELRKVHRVIGKNMPGAPHEVLLVLDATNGQNAVTQAKMFSETVNVTGIALTKLDGTAKGGIIVSIVETLDIPIKLIGIGERMDDLRDFDAEAFTRALFEA